VPPRLTLDQVGIERYPRREFYDERFTYNPGDCVTLLVPFGGGKTQLGLELLDEVVSPELRGTIFVMKPKDATISRFYAARKDEFEMLRDWPPPTLRIGRRIMGKKPSGYILWPRETGNPEYDDAVQEAIFRRAIRMMYVSAKKHPNIMFVDETYSLENELNLGKDLRRAWTKGRSVGNGLWAASQRPAFISAWAYQAQHLFLGFDPDKRTQDRYAEIGAGFDPETIKAIVRGLQQYEFLYISREDRAMCIVEAS
jgi:hypothetical protein